MKKKYFSLLMSIILVFNLSVSVNAESVSPSFKSTPLNVKAIPMNTGIVTTNDSISTNNPEQNVELLESLLSDQLNNLSLDTTKGSTTADTLTAEILNDPELYKQWKSNLYQPKERMLSSYSYNNYISNEYLAVKYNYGVINIGTTGGNPNTPLDDNQRLLYGWPDGNTSKTTIRIDGIDYIFSSNNYISEDQGNKIIANMIINNITIRQICSFEMNPSTGRKDIVKINYEVSNNDSINHSIGIRIMLDTQLGNNDGAPFRVAGKGNITSEIEMTGAYIPQYWQAFDVLDNPSIIANGTFYNSFNEKPDKIQFASWPDIQNTSWEYQITPEKRLTHDSAVGIYFNPKSITPGNAVNMSTYYGISSFTNSGSSSNLSAHITAPQTLAVNQITSNYYSNPYTLTCYVKNNGTNVIQNATATLNLPNSGELAVLSSGGKTVTIGDIAPNTEKLVSFSILANSQTIDKNLNYSVDIKAENENQQNIPVQINLPKVTSFINNTIILNKTSISIAQGQTETLRATLNNAIGLVTWSSNVPSIVKVNSSGVLTAVSPGTAIVTASIGGKFTSCMVTVTGTPISLQRITLSPSILALSINQSKTLTVNFTPSNAPNKQIRSWISSNPNVASVSGGRVVALNFGTTTITAISQDGSKQAICVVNVNESIPPVQMNGISFSQNVSGPQISIDDKSFPLFNIEVGLDLYPNIALKVVYDPLQQKYLMYGGDLDEDPETEEENPNGTLTINAKKLRKDTYEDVKELMSMVGKKPSIKDFYNSYKKLVSKPSKRLMGEGSMTTFYYAAFVYSNGNFILVEGGAGVLFSAEAEARYRFPPNPILYAKFALKGSLQAGFKFEQIGSGTVGSVGTLEGKFVPSIGIGGDILLAGVELGIEGELKALVTLPRDRAFVKNKDLKVSISASLYYSWQIFGYISFKQKFSLGEDSILYPTNNLRSVNSITTIGLENMSLMKRDYLNKTTFTANNTLRFKKAQISDTESTTILTNTYPYGSPQIINLGGGKSLLVYVEDVDSRSDENRTGLYYSIFDGTQWSDPVLVNDDGTADFSPMLAKSDNNIFVTWQNQEVQLPTGAEINDFSSNSGISVAKFNGSSFGTPQQITNADGLLDNAPYISVSDDKSAIVWTKNSENDVFGVEGTNSIFRSTFDGSVWSSPENVVPDAGSISQYSTAFDGSNNIIVYTKNTNIDSTTIQDTELMLVKGSNAPLQITNNDVSDTNATLIANGNSSSLFWNSGGVLNYIADINTISPIEIGNSIGGAFKVLSNNNDKAIIWEQSTGFSSELYGMFYENDKWGSSVQITNDGNRIRETSGFINDNGEIVLSYMSTQIQEVIEDSDDPMGDSSLIVTTLSPSCDLEFGSDIAYKENEVVPNGSLSLSAYIQNKGKSNVSSFKVNISNGIDISSVIINESLASGEGKYIDIPYTLPSTITRQELGLTLEPIGVNEYNSNNNSTDVVIGDSKLRISTPSITGMGQNRNVAVTIYNDGYTDSTQFTVNLYLNSLDVVPITSQTINSVMAKSARTVEFNIPIDNDTFSSGDNLIYVEIDTGSEKLTNSGVLTAPESTNSLTISNSAQVGNVVMFNLDNNLSVTTSGTVLVTGGNYDNQMARSLSLEGLGSQSIQMDITTLNNESELNIMILGEDDQVVSNIVTLQNGGDVTQYSLSLNSGNDGSVSGTAGNYNQGDVINILATPNEGYQFVNWTSSNGGVFANENNPSTTFTMPANETTVTANFEAKSIPKHTLVIASGNGGLISSGTGGEYESNAQINLTAIPNEGYQFVNWTSSNGGVFANENSSSTTFTMPANETTVTANFELITQNKYTITASAGIGGTISPSGSILVNENANQSFSITANSGYSISEVIVDGVSKGAVSSYMFSNVTKNHNISVKFTVNRGSDTDNSNKREVLGVNLSKNRLSLVLGSTEKLVETINPQNATNKSVTWKSSNPSVATVVNGKITAVGVGVAIITVMTEDGNKIATCEVNVTKNSVLTGIKLNKSSTIIKLGETETLESIILPENVVLKNGVWKSNNSSVATVSSTGKITAVGLGTTTITVRTEDGDRIANCMVTVIKPVAVKGIKLNKNSTTVNVGQIETLKTTLLPINATNKTVTWKSSNNKVVTVSSTGKITAVGKGTAIITVTTKDGNKIATCKVVVNSVSVKDVKLNKSSITMKAGKTTTLKAVLSPTNATNKNVTWKSSNNKVVTVSSTGKVTAIGKGKANITVTTKDGNKKALCLVTVLPN